MATQTDIGLTASQIQRQVFRRVKKYEKLSFLEQFAMFIGKAQILELGLKNLLARRYNYDRDKIDNWTLGYTARELKQCGLRSDFIALLGSVVKHRNYITHEFLANDAILRQILGRDSGRLELRHLEKGIYELEQIILLHDWCEEHNAWG